MIVPSGVGQGLPLRLEDFQKDFIRNVYDPVDEKGNRTIRRALLSIARKNGKGLALDTPLPTPTGWTTMGDVKPGDKLIDESGRECSVTFVSDHRRLDCYRVTFSNGEQIVCDGDHLWLTHARVAAVGARRKRGLCRSAVRDTREIFATQRIGPRQDTNHSLAMPAGIDGRKVPFPIDPYLLGLWLGDGVTKTSQVHCGYADLTETAKAVSACGYAVEIACEKTSAVLLVRPRDQHGTPVNRSHPLNLQKQLRGVGVLGRKHIPSQLLRANRAQRVALLQGLMDSDGTVSKSGRLLEFSTTLPALADGFGELLATLGLKYSRRERSMRCNGRPVPGVNHRFQFMAFRDEIPAFRLPRKLARMRTRAECARSARSRTVQIVSVEKVDTVTTKCIQVDSPNRLFLCGKTMLPTHNTALSAGLVLAHLVGPEAKMNGEVLSAASDRDQASIIYKMAKQMVELDPELSQMCKCMDSVKRIVCYHNGSFYQSLSAEARRQHGGNPHFIIYDELAQAKDRELFDVLTTSFGAQEEGLFLAISTQSNDPASVMSEMADDAINQRNGLLDDPYFYGVVYTVPEDSEDSKIDIWNPEVWKLANPALGTFRTLRDFEALAHKAQRSPSAEAGFRNLFLNQRVDGTQAFVNSSDWKACAADVSDDELIGKPCFGGLDLSNRNDLTCFALVFDLGDRIGLRIKFWAPAEDIGEKEKKDGARYREWASRGLMTLTPGRLVDLEYVVPECVEMARKYGMRHCAFDRWRIDGFKKILEDNGVAEKYFQLLNYGQGFKDMAPAIDKLEETIINHQLMHGGNPVLTYCVANVRLVQDPVGNRKFDKRKLTRRIDGAVTLAMAMGARDKPVEGYTGPSVYERRGLVVL